MRKRKLNPSLGEVGISEDRSLQLEVGSVSNRREVVAPVAQPTVSLFAQGVLAGRQPGKGSEVATGEEPNPPRIEGLRPETIPAGTAEARPVETETTGNHISSPTEQVLVDRLGLRVINK